MGCDIANGRATRCLTIFVSEMGVSVDDKIDIVLIDDAPEERIAQHPVFQWWFVAER